MASVDAGSVVQRFAICSKRNIFRVRKHLLSPCFSAHESYINVLIRRACVCRNFEFSVPYPVNRDQQEVIKTYLDTTGRPVIVAHKNNLVEHHIQDFEVRGAQMHGTHNTWFIQPWASACGIRVVEFCTHRVAVSELFFAFTPVDGTCASSCEQAFKRHFSKQTAVLISAAEVQLRETAAAAGAPASRGRVLSAVRRRHHLRAPRLLHHQGTHGTQPVVTAVRRTEPIRESNVQLQHCSVGNSSHKLSRPLESVCWWVLGK